MTHTPPSGAARAALSELSAGDPTAADLACVLAERVAALEAAFVDIAQQRMAGVALMHPGVQVQATPFVALDAQLAVGILVTPWFMNLLRLPLTRSDRCHVGSKTTHRVGDYAIEFTSAFEPAIGGFESCSVYSPLTMFEDHAAVYATAQAVMHTLLSASAADTPARLGRRAVLFGRAARERRDAASADGKAR
jgi:[NiFe] hydrogenase assembly HybE family chaperone